MTQIIKSIPTWNKIRKEITKKKLSLGLTPTMGNLHLGHISLMKRAKKENNLTALWIFINPTQFNSSADYKNYPRTLQEDILLAKNLGINYILIFNYKHIYPDDYTYKISESKISPILEGRFRPGHFEGMLTVVLKLLLIIKPHKAYFGEKDFQQLLLIKNMVKAFFIETQIIACKIIREPSGLAYSSRNNLLTPEEYQTAKLFPKIFLNKKLSCEKIKKQLLKLNFKIDYIENYQNRRLAAVRLGHIRLLDNYKMSNSRNSK